MSNGFSQIIDTYGATTNYNREGVSMCTFLGLGSAIADIFTFLAPADQQKLRCTASEVCAWFDSAAENGSLPLYISVETTTTVCRWKHSSLGLREDAASSRLARGWKNRKTPAANTTTTLDPSSKHATVTLHVRNFCLSTIGKPSRNLLQATEDGNIEEGVINALPYVPIAHKLVVTGLFGIRSIGSNFCKGATATVIEFRGDADQLRSVGRGWLSSCPKLKSVIFGDFPALEEVGRVSECDSFNFYLYSGWLSDCRSLESVTFSGEFPQLKKVGCQWLKSCPQLKSVNFTKFTTLEEVGEDWLGSCESLGLVTYASEYPKLRVIGGGWMKLCSQLKSVDLTGFTALEELGGDGMANCENLETITFASTYPSLRKVGDGWLSNCPKLEGKQRLLEVT